MQSIAVYNYCYGSGVISSLLNVRESFSEMVAEHMGIYSSFYQILMEHCHGLICVPQRDVNVWTSGIYGCDLFRNKIFTDTIRLRWGHYCES